MRQPHGMEYRLEWLRDVKANISELLLGLFNLEGGGDMSLRNVTWTFKGLHIVLSRNHRWENVKSHISELWLRSYALFCGLLYDALGRHVVRVVRWWMNDE
jgi:hypothetical protein